MIDKEVKSIYDRLSGYESKMRYTSAYPIHKKLVFDQPDLADIYFWILKTIELTPNSLILDAGCGVGYGSFVLAEGYQSSVLGISLSDVEIDKANQFHQDLFQSLPCRFQVKNFDSQFERKFDLIVAIESLKHAAEVKNTVRHLYNQLTPNGQLLIIEDLWDGSSIDATAKTLMADWSLPRLYTKEDYLVPGAQISFNTLDQYIPEKNAWGIKLKYAFNNTLAKLKGEKGNLYEIYRGGFALDQLYLQGRMSYQSILIKKTTYA